jgi:hypothetical protein
MAEGISGQKVDEKTVAAADIQCLSAFRETLDERFKRTR